VDEDSAASTDEFNVFDEDNYGGSLSSTSNCTAKNITFDASTGRFTVDSGYDGTYFIGANLYLNVSLASEMTVRIDVNGITVYDVNVYIHNAAMPAARPVGILYDLSGNDYIEVTIENIGAGAETTTIKNGTTFNMYKIA
jgi:hypothetical protein